MLAALVAKKRIHKIEQMQTKQQDNYVSFQTLQADNTGVCQSV